MSVFIKVKNLTIRIRYIYCSRGFELPVNISERCERAKREYVHEQEQNRKNTNFLEYLENF